ncbi:Conidiation-specific expression protein [Colletotrichum higginsianum IMI 349063]|uniref:Conidiation-specific expression protein n=3 Tax=Colletotrichum higginsianum TaxID=80884 RepID=A0A1B7YTM9_COLHI|nr:Conidiation-specific expression protein [Colletotrichum higginsianum IMI 349063]OBR15387.1 Conidiation-specific expression protein [Colletotrichum higginsianum IMI 349063]
MPSLPAFRTIGIFLIHYSQQLRDELLTIDSYILIRVSKCTIHHISASINMDSGKNTNPPVSPSGRRRSSGTLFQGLMDQKRHEGTSARRQSMTDSKPTPGFLGQMWHNWTRGPASPPK